MISGAIECKLHNLVRPSRRQTRRVSLRIME